MFEKHFITETLGDGFLFSEEKNKKNKQNHRDTSYRYKRFFKCNHSTTLFFFFFPLKSALFWMRCVRYLAYVRYLAECRKI